MDSFESEKPWWETREKTLDVPLSRFEGRHALVQLGLASVS